MCKPTTYLPLLAALMMLLPTLALAEDGDAEAAGDESTSSESDTAGQGDAAGTTDDAAQQAADDAATQAAGADDDAAPQAAQAAAAATEATAAAEAAGADATTDAPPADAAPDETEKKKPTVNLVMEAGGVWLAGNTKSITANGAVRFGLKHGMNAFGLGAGINYGRSFVADLDEWSTTGLRVFADLRYDRFLTDFNSIFLSVGAFQDKFAGFDYRVSANLGYSHLLVNTDVHKLTGEAGVNYTHDRYVEAVAPRDQNFVGARVFLGYKLTPSSTFGFSQSVEGLFGGTDNVDARFDGRLVSATAITANLSKIFALKVGFDLAWDFTPPEGFEPVDTVTSVTLVATLM